MDFDLAFVLGIENDGFKDGFADGLWLGICVGIENDGFKDGFVDGLWLGTFVGSENDGFKDGFVDGLRLGICVGIENDGFNDGFVDGLTNKYHFHEADLYFSEITKFSKLAWTVLPPPQPIFWFPDTTNRKNVFYIVKRAQSQKKKRKKNIWKFMNKKFYPLPPRRFRGGG